MIIREKGILKKRRKPPHGEDNGQCRLRESDVINIRAIYKYCNVKIKYLSEIYSISVSQIHGIINRRSWKHI